MRITSQRNDVEGTTFHKIIMKFCLWNLVRMEEVPVVARGIGMMARLKEV